MSDHHHDHDHDGHDHDELDEHGDEAAEREAAERALRRQLALSQVRQYGDPALRMRAQEVERFDDELKSLAERMVALMHEADGVGLAANQVGIVRRFFVCTLDGEDRALVNPAITKASGQTETDDEGCLSLGDVRVPVERPIEVTLDGVDLDGNPVHLELAGMAARIVQHELDHLDGTLTIDRTDPDARRDALRRLRPKLALR
ncbi:MAG: peptide deformylase [Gaiellales bacterium]